MRVLLYAWMSLLAVSASNAVAFGDTVHSGGGKLHVFIEDDRFELPYAALVAWIQRSSDVVSDYYGRFPVDEAYVAVTGSAGKGVLHGTALGEIAAVVNVKVGSSADAQDLADDWVLVHELIHLGFPKVRSRHHWAEEGLAVYVESVARVQAGDVSPDTMWRHFVNGMPNGLPQQGDQGLDNTPTWGRIYWGGAMFFLLADIEIIELSQGRRSLRDALRAIVAAGHDITATSDLREVFRVADQATGLTVLSDLYEQMASAPVYTDLDRLWRRLGIERAGSGVVLLDDAELAGVRKMIARASPVDSCS